MIGLHWLLTDPMRQRSAVWHLDADALVINASFSIETAMLCYAMSC